MKNLFEKYKNDIFELKNIKGVDAIILFGSYAEKKVKPLSDLDICIITNQKISTKNKIKILSSGTDELDISLFHELPLSLQHKILTKGEILYSKIDLKTLKIKTMNKWFDFRPIIKRLHKSRGYSI